MKKTIISAFMLLFAGAGLSAQNLDPTVVVTNTYTQQAGAVEKPSQLLEMPDSVMQFNLDLDYYALSVPYRGAYEFKPYLVELRPTVRPSSEGTLFVQGGAGYSFHPELTLVWNPIKNDKFRLNLYADHYSYTGNFRGIGLKDNLFKDNGSFYTGSSLRTIAGANGLFTWSGGRVEADLGYRHVLGSDNLVQNALWNAMDFNARLESDYDSQFYYIVKNSESVLWAPAGGNELHSKTNASLGTHFGEHYIRMGVQADIFASKAGSAGNISFVPRYIFSLEDFTFDLGAKVSFMYRSAGELYPITKHPGFVFPLFPDVHINFCVVPDMLALYADVTGGHRMYTREEILDYNPFLASFTGSMDAMVEPVNASIGARGNVSARFYYDFKLGYAVRINALMWGFDSANAPVIGYSPRYRMFFTDLSFGWKGERVDLGSNLKFRKTDLNEAYLFAPSMVEGSLKAVYNWGHRIHAGFNLEGRTECVAVKGTLPGYVDLGLYGDLQMTRYLGFWLKVGNLLNQSIQRVPFHAEQGIYFTVGATFNL